MSQVFDVRQTSQSPLPVGSTREKAYRKLLMRSAANRAQNLIQYIRGSSAAIDLFNIAGMPIARVKDGAAPRMLSHMYTVATLNRTRQDYRNYSHYRQETISAGDRKIHLDITEATIGRKLPTVEKSDRRNYIGAQRSSLPASGTLARVATAKSETWEAKSRPVTSRTSRSKSANVSRLSHPLSNYELRGNPLLVGSQQKPTNPAPKCCTVNDTEQTVDPTTTKMQTSGQSQSDKLFTTGTPSRSKRPKSHGAKDGSTRQRKPRPGTFRSYSMTSLSFLSRNPVVDIAHASSGTIGALASSHQKPHYRAPGDSRGGHGELAPFRKINFLDDDSRSTLTERNVNILNTVDCFDEYRSDGGDRRYNSRTRNWVQHMLAQSSRESGPEHHGVIHEEVEDDEVEGEREHRPAEDQGFVPADRDTGDGPWFQNTTDSHSEPSNTSAVH